MLLTVKQVIKTIFPVAAWRNAPANCASNSVLAMNKEPSR